MTGLPIVGFYYWTMNQYVIQRVLGSRDIAAAGRASMIAAALKLLPLFLMTIPGAMAVALLPGLDHPDKVFPTMVATFTPSGLTGLILAGVIAALMSTCSATLNSAATLITMDFVQPHKPGITQRQLVRTARIATVVITLIVATWAPMIGTADLALDGGSRHPRHARSARPTRASRRSHRDCTGTLRRALDGSGNPRRDERHHHRLLVTAAFPGN